MQQLQKTSSMLLAKFSTYYYSVLALKKALHDSSGIPPEYQTILLENGHELLNQQFIYADQVLNAMYLYNNAVTSTQHSLDVDPIPVICKR
jgi:hypothetical protein